MKVTVYGVGYVGLVQAAVLAQVGHNVLCVDIDEDKIAALKRSQIPIYEPGLESLVKDNLQQGRLEFTTDCREGVIHGEVQFIAVGTPPDKNGAADITYVLAVAKTLGQYTERPIVVVNKSTVPVGTAAKVKTIIRQALVARNLESVEFSVVSNPEFLKEGSAVNDCMKPDRIIIGVNDNNAEKIMRKLYAPFNRNHEKIITMDPASAELTKYAANCMLATKISFMNEMANIAERVGADIESVRLGIGSDPRIGYHFIYPGVGYGGSCFPKDVSALINIADNNQFDAKVLKSVDARNNLQKTLLFNKLIDFFQGRVRGKCIALWGLAFKPNTDDVREAPARVLMESLWSSGASIQAYDPAAMDEIRHIYGERKDLVLCQNKEQALKGADALVVMTEWSAFKAPDFEFIAKELRSRVIFDGRNLYDPESMRAMGFTYICIGKPPVYGGHVMMKKADAQDTHRHRQLEASV